MGVPAPQVSAKNKQRPHRHRGVQQTEEQPRAHQPQVRHKQQRECHRHHQRAQVVEGQHLRDQLAQGPARCKVVFQNAHHEGDFQTHQHAYQAHQPVQQQPKRQRRMRRQSAVGDEQHSRHQAAHQADQQFDFQELRDQLALDMAAGPRAQTHREQIGADDGAELKHRVAQQPTGQRAGGQFIDQPAGRHHEHRDQQSQLGRGRAGRRAGCAAGCCGVGCGLALDRHPASVAHRAAWHADSVLGRFDVKLSS